MDALERCVKQMNDALAHREAAAYRHLDAEFHGSLFRLCGNALLAEAHEAIEFRVQSLRTRLSVAPEANEATLAEHTSIVGALVKRDLGRAHDLLMAHICKTEANYLCLLPR